MRRSSRFPLCFALAAGTALTMGAHAQTITLGSTKFTLGGRLYGFAGAASGQNQTYSGFEALRLYPGIDGLTEDGLQYGALADLREDAATLPGQIRPGQFYTRRLYAYLGTRALGTIRIGTTDGASEIYQVGTFDGGPSMFSDGGWNGLAHYGFAPAANPAWPFASSRYYYATNKIVYLSPMWRHINVNLSYEPNVRGANLNDGGQYSNNSNSDYTDAGNIGQDAAARKNTFDIATRYARAFGDLALIGTASYVISGKAEQYGPIRYQGLNFGDLGASASYAGVTLAGNLQHGKFNGVWQLSPQGAKDSTAYSLGISYKIGSYAVGASFFNYTSPGISPLATGTRSEDGVSVGGSYLLSTHISLYANYLLGQRHQTGFDFNSGTAGSSSANNVHTQGVTLGGRVFW